MTHLLKKFEVRHNTLAKDLAQLTAESFDAAAIQKHVKHPGYQGSALNH